MNEKQKSYLMKRVNEECQLKLNEIEKLKVYKPFKTLSVAEKLTKIKQNDYCLKRGFTEHDFHEKSHITEEGNVKTSYANIDSMIEFGEVKIERDYEKVYELKDEVIKIKRSICDNIMLGGEVDIETFLNPIREFKV